MLFPVRGFWKIRLFAFAALIVWIGCASLSASSPRGRVVGYSSPGRPPGSSAPAPGRETVRPVSLARPARGQIDGSNLRGVWVTRWNYQNAQDVEQAIANCARMGANVVFFQARGAGTAFYRSGVEPWAFELTSKSPATTGQDPGWDPLGTAVAAAKRHGIQLHAYINVMPGWRASSAPPASAKQLWTEHPEWFAVDSSGRRMDPADWYAFLDPALPEVRSYLAALAADLVRRYPVDGLHLDYVRYPGDKGDFGYSRRTQALFSAETGVASPQSDPAAWRAWRALQVERAVAGVNRAAKSVRPGLTVSAAVFADEEAARLKHCQLSWQWPARRSLDFIIPMNYVADHAEFRRRASFFAKRVPRGGVAMGLLAEGPASKLARQWSAWKGAGGVALFAYGDFFPEHRATSKAAAMRQLWAPPASR